MISIGLMKLSGHKVVITVALLIAVLIAFHISGGFRFICVSNRACTGKSVCVFRDGGPVLGWIPGTILHPGTCWHLPPPGLLSPN